MDATDLKIQRIKRWLWRAFLWILGIGALLVVCARMLHRYTDISLLMIEPSQIEYAFRSNNRDIQHLADDGWIDFTVRGVELDSNQNDADYETYLRWLTAISEMNANAVRVHACMPPDFYRALCDINEGGSELWLLQGVELTDEAFAEMTDLRSGGMVQLFRTEGRRVIDAVHGNKIRRGYTADASRYTMAYIVGDHWDSDLVLYTDHVAVDIAGRYTGRYAAVWNTGKAVPTLIAEVCNDLLSYETRKYAMQHIIGLGNSQPTDILFHDISWAAGLNENIADVNTTHVAVTARVKTGIFAALRVDTGVMQNLSHDPVYIEYKDTDGRRNAVRYYLDALYNAHRVPLMLSGTTMSAARGVSGLDALYGYDRGGVGETVQADGLTFVYTQALEAGFCGGCAGYYLDNPARTAWNMEMITTHNGAWLDMQDSEQSLGIVALEPGAEAICTVDGDPAEWAGRDAIVDRDGVLLQAVGDEKYLYLRVHVDGYDAQNDVLYIPLDVTPLSGTRENRSQNLIFDRDMDFFLTINGKKRAKLMVQKYYEPVEALNSQALDNRYWYVAPPDAHADDFVATRQYVRQALYPLSGGSVDAVVLETGQLQYGNADPAATDYNALTCYSVGNEDVEVRIPWALLQFTDPSQGRILGDFYTDGVTSISIDAINIGLSVYRDGAVVHFDSGALAVPCYEKAVYRERMRPAYYALQTLFDEVGR